MSKIISALLSDPDPAVRRRAAEDLSLSRGYAPVAALAAGLRDENKGVRDAAIHSLIEIGSDAAARAVVEYLGDSNIVIRNLAADLLMKLGPQSIQALLPSLYDNDQDVRKFAVDILGSIGSREAIPDLIHLLSDSDPNVIVSAAEALGNIRSTEAVDVLCKLFEAREDSKSVVAEALGKIGGEQASDFLLAKFCQSISSDPSDPVLFYTILEALAAVGSKKSLTVLQSHIPSLKGRLRNVLLHSIVRIAERYSRRYDELQSFRADVISALADDHEEIRISAAKVLSAIPGADITATLLQSFGSSEEYNASVLPLLLTRDSIMTVLIELLEQGTIQISKEILAVIKEQVMSIRYGSIPREFMDPQARLLQRSFDAVRRSWPEADHDVRSLIADLLFRLDGDRTIEFLSGLVEDPDPWLRIHVIEMLGPIEDRRIPEFLVRQMQDEDEMVREAAASALEAKGYSLEYQS